MAINPGIYDAVVSASEFTQAKSGAYMVHFILEVRPTDQTPITYHNNVCIVKADGSVMQRGLETLAKLFPNWDRADFGFFDVQDNTAGTECSVTLDWGSYNGQPRLEVKWLNPRGKSAGKTLTPKGVKLPPALAGKLRAALSTMPRPSGGYAITQRATSKTATVAVAAPVAPAPVAPKVERLDYNGCWQKVHAVLAARGGMSEEQIGEKFLAALSKMADGRDQTALTSEEYNNVVAEATSEMEF